MSKVLAIDYGSKRVGLASGESEFGMAFPREVLLNDGLGDLVSRVLGIVYEIEAEVVVVGLPLSMHDGQTDNPILSDVNEFVQALSSSLEGVKVVLFDERLSSFEADEIMDKIKNEVGAKLIGRDAYAACVILQRYFDRLKK